VTGFSARYFDGRTAASRPVWIHVIGADRLQVSDGAQNPVFCFDEVTVQRQLGHHPAIIELPGGGRLEIAAANSFHAAIDPLIGKKGWVFWLESNWLTVALLLAVTAALIWTAANYGIPVAARLTAKAVPVSVDTQIGDEGLRILDAYMLAPSELTEERRDQISQVFLHVVTRVGDDHDFRLVFRKGGRVGANALALPSGIVILTDELEALAEHDEELAAVLAHEVGHAVHRHALRALIQNSLVAGLIVVVTGDVGSIANLAAAIPTLLAERSYTRDFEHEADDVAYDYLRLEGIDEQRFADLITRLENNQGQPDTIDLLATHPSAAERSRKH
jgi:Zn-dependent protease with chaperone function